MEDSKKRVDEILNDLNSLFQGHLNLSSDKHECATAIASAVTHALGTILGRTCAFGGMTVSRFSEFKKEILDAVDQNATDQYKQAILFKKAMIDLNDLANTLFKTKH